MQNYLFTAFEMVIERVDNLQAILERPSPAADKNLFSLGDHWATQTPRASRATAHRASPVGRLFFRRHLVIVCFVLGSSPPKVPNSCMARHIQNLKSRGKCRHCRCFRPPGQPPRKREKREKTASMFGIVSSSIDALFWTR